MPVSGPAETPWGRPTPFTADSPHWVPGSLAPALSMRTFLCKRWCVSDRAGGNRVPAGKSADHDMGRMPVGFRRALPPMYFSNSECSPVTPTPKREVHPGPNPVVQHFPEGPRLLHPAARLPGRWRVLPCPAPPRKVAPVLSCPVAARGVETGSSGPAKGPDHGLDRNPSAEIPGDSCLHSVRLHVLTGCPALPRAPDPAAPSLPGECGPRHVDRVCNGRLQCCVHPAGLEPARPPPCVSGGW